MKNEDPWRESLLNYFLSDLGMDLNQAISLPRVFFRCASHFYTKPALLEKTNGNFHPLTYSDLLDRCQAFAMGLLDRGFKNHERLALFLKNSPDWVVADFGTMFAGGTTVPIYDNLAPEAILHILRDSGATGILVEDQAQFERVRGLLPELPGLQFVLLRDPKGVALKSGKIASFQGFLEKGAAARRKQAEALERRLDTVRRDDVASIVYTSGTTGNPKGVMLTHRNFLSNVYGVSSIADITARDLMLSVLPLSHTFERTVGYYLPLLLGATVAYAESIEAISQNLLEVQPTVVCAVPRLFEKIHVKMLKKIESSGLLARQFFSLAQEIGQAFHNAQDRELRQGVSDRRQRHRAEERFAATEVKIGNPLLRASHQLAERLVYGKLRESLGGRLRFFVSGGAALKPEVTNFFRNLNITIYEGYGMTESSPVISFNFGYKFKPGTVGKLLPHVQVKLSSEGEILVKGPNVMKGYFNNPQATADAIDGDGWLRTGDVGVFDEENYLRITDRIKELLVMSNGKNVAPLLIEGKLTQSPLVAHALVVGNNQKYVAALLFPALEELRDLAKRLGISEKAFEALCKSPEILAHFSRLVETANLGLSRYEQIKKFELIPRELTVEGGEITPTLKLKRRVLEVQFRASIAELFPANEKK